LSDEFIRQKANLIAELLLRFGTVPIIG